jgi:hypothetical protein
MYMNMYVYMCSCIYVFMYICVHVYMYLLIRVYIFTGVHATVTYNEDRYIIIYLPVYMRRSHTMKIGIFICIYMFICMNMNVYEYVYMYMYMFTDVCAHVDMYLYIQWSRVMKISYIET